MSSLVFFFFFFSILLFLFCRVSFLSFFPSANRVPVPTACLNEPLLLPCDHRLPFSAETFLFSLLRLESEGKRHACAYTKTVYESTLLLKERASLPRGRVSLARFRVKLSCEMFSLVDAEFFFFR